MSSLDVNVPGDTQYVFAVCYRFYWLQNVASVSVIFNLVFGEVLCVIGLVCQLVRVVGCFERLLSGFILKTCILLLCVAVFVYNFINS